MRTWTSRKSARRSNTPWQQQRPKECECWLLTSRGCIHFSWRCTWAHYREGGIFAPLYILVYFVHFYFFSCIHDCCHVHVVCTPIWLDWLWFNLQNYLAIDLHDCVFSFYCTIFAYDGPCKKQVPACEIGLFQCIGNSGGQYQRGGRTLSWVVSWGQGWGQDNLRTCPNYYWADLDRTARTRLGQR